MDFDFAHITAPFRMQPGLRRMADAERHLTPLVSGSALWHEKHAVWQAGHSRLCVDGFDPSAAIDAIADRARREALAGTPGDDSPPLELAFEEDFAVLDGTSGTIPWLCVCTPSHWAPETKLGQSLASIHGPVADNAMLLAATAGLVRLATGGGRWERFVWTVTPSSRYDQHPARHARTPWPAAADHDVFASQCHLRAERQTFFPVAGHAQAVFTIRVMLQPLTEAVATAEQARRLHGALASVSPEVLAYKGLTAAREPLLHWLARRISQDAA